MKRSLLRTCTRRVRCLRRELSCLTSEERLAAISKPPYVLPDHKKIVSPPMVYISGEEMTRYTMQLILEQWIEPHIDISKWQFFDLSCASRDDTDDAVLINAVEAGAAVGAIFKEPTITPSAAQVQAMGLKKAWGSPNGAMRRGWNGITISRDTIMIEGMELGFKRPVLFERQAVGGEYSAGWGLAGKGSVRTTFTPRGGGEDVIIDEEPEVEEDIVVDDMVFEPKEFVEEELIPELPLFIPSVQIPRPTVKRLKRIYAQKEKHV